MRVPDSLQKELPANSLLMGFDSETTGLNGQIVEFSFWCAEGQFTRRCRPTCSMHPRAERAHGISLSELQAEELYQTVALECQAFLASLVRRTGARTLVLVGHNDRSCSLSAWHAADGSLFRARLPGGVACACATGLAQVATSNDVGGGVSFWRLEVA